MTIHQPSSRLLYMFHKVVLLFEGNPLYFGSGARAMDYFQTLGFTPCVSMNPADFLLDLANGVSPDDSEDPAAVKEKLILAYNNNLANKVQEEDEVGDIGDRCEPSRRKWTTTWWQQFYVLLSRGLKKRKHETVNVFKITEVVVVAFIAGLFWWQSPISRLQDQIGLLYFSSGFWGFFPLFNAIFTFPAEIMILAKERSSGMYRLSSYFMARILIVVILPTIFITITYWMAGLKHTLASFFSYLFSLLLNVLVEQGLGLALGALIMDLKQATITGSALMHTILIAGGYFVQHVPDFISWMKYLSFSNYSYRLMLWSQYKPGDTYPCEGHEKLCLVQDFPSIKSVGLKGQHVSLIGLGLMFVAYRLIAYVALMRIGVVKKVNT